MENYLPGVEEEKITIEDNLGMDILMMLKFLLKLMFLIKLSFLLVEDIILWH